MDDLELTREDQQPEFYEVIPEFNSQGRLCNYGSGINEKVKVLADEWERFNLLAGRQHKIVDGVAVFDEKLKPCMPDIEKVVTTEETLAGLIFTLVESGVL